jgi:hypothetical protein
MHDGLEPGALHVGDPVFAATAVGVFPDFDHRFPLSQNGRIQADAEASGQCDEQLSTWGIHEEVS